MEVLLTPVLVLPPTAVMLLRHVDVPLQLLVAAGFVVSAGMVIGCITAAQDAGRARQRRYGLQHRLQPIVADTPRSPERPLDLPRQFRLSYL